MADKRFFCIAACDQDSLLDFRKWCEYNTQAQEIGIGYAGVDAEYLVAREPIVEDESGKFLLSGTSGFFRPDPEFLDIAKACGVSGVSRCETGDKPVVFGLDSAELIDAASIGAKKQERLYYSVCETYDESIDEYCVNLHGGTYIQESARLGLPLDIRTVTGTVNLVNPREGNKVADSRDIEIPLMTKQGNILNVDVMLNAPLDMRMAPEVFSHDEMVFDNHGNPVLMLSPEFNGFKSGENVSVELIGDYPYTVEWQETDQYKAGYKIMTGTEIVQRFDEAQKQLALSDLTRQAGDSKGPSGLGIEFE